MMTREYEPREVQGCEFKGIDPQPDESEPVQEYEHGVWHRLSGETVPNEHSPELKHFVEIAQVKGYELDRILVGRVRRNGTMHGKWLGMYMAEGFPLEPTHFLILPNPEWPDIDEPVYFFEDQEHPEVDEHLEMI